jgi:hypothetical protein
MGELGHWGSQTISTSVSATPSTVFVRRLSMSGMVLASGQDWEVRVMVTLHTSPSMATS